ncbi:hypothetical protein EK21DRAFT_99264 [Setomelanomma holmii]|uniref:Rhodopsin domain-containing protein n=1 Tax=Setomelanomma holmii TaxID=210430 RepID=A0A9P4LLV0_9PLEO|nr:hypothetical protein EK21DRAFT_99264 [Setomelanomma holmii]
MAEPSSLPSAQLIAYTNAQNLIAEAATLFSIAALTVLLRCYLLAAATLVYYVLQVSLSLGKHLSVIQLIPVICGPAVTVVKISVAFLLLRCATKKTLPLLSGQSHWLSGGFLLTCASTLASWNYRLLPLPLGTGTARCFMKETFGQIALCNAANQSSICLTDFFLVFLPVPLIWQLKLNVRTRASLILILSLAILAGVAGIIRAMVFNSILKDPRRFFHDKYAMSGNKGVGCVYRSVNMVVRKRPAQRR